MPFAPSVAYIRSLSPGSDPNRDASREGLRGIGIRHLAALAAVARERSFRAAARRLGYVQSAVSQQLAELERAVGSPLVERTPRGAAPRLTAAGESLLAHVERMLTRVNAVNADLRALGAGEGRALRVGAPEAEAVRLVVPIVESLRERGWRPRLVVSELPEVGEPLERLEDCSVDLVLAALPLPPGPFEYVELLDDPYVLLVPTSSVLAERPGRPSLGDLAELPLVGRVGSRVEEELSARFGQLNIVQRARSESVVRALVGTGVGGAIVPRLSVDPSDLETVAIDLGDQLTRRSLALVWHGDRLPDPAAARFRQAAVDVCARIAGERESIDRLSG